MTMTWDEHYDIAKQYYEENGHLNVPSKTKLYTWIVVVKLFCNTFG